jgi:periplasmic protein TonB
LNNRALKLGMPTYPRLARAAHISGVVEVKVLIDEDGNVIEARAISGHPVLWDASVEAAKNSLFSPTVLSGQPVKVSDIIRYNFIAQ